MDWGALRGTLQMLLGVGVIVLGVLDPEVRSDPTAFGTLMALGWGLLGNVPPGPGENAEMKRMRDELSRLRAEASVPPPPFPPPPLGRR